jgi:putative transposase
MVVNSVLAEFGGTKKKAKAEYRRFIREGIDQCKIPAFTGGGLIRSQGGWSAVLSMRRKKQKEESDERILGSGDFVYAILKEAEEKHLRQLKTKRSGRTISDIMREECSKGKVSVEELR